MDDLTTCNVSDSVNTLNSILENLCITDSINNIENNTENEKEIDSIVLQLDSLDIKHNFKKSNNENSNVSDNNNENIDNIIAESNLMDKDDIINQNVLKYHKLDNFINKCNQNNIIYNKDDSTYELVCLNNNDNNDMNIIKNLKQIITYLLDNNFTINSIYFKDNIFNISALKSDYIKYDLSIDLKKLQFIRDKRIKYFLKDNNFIKYSGIAKVHKSISKKRNNRNNRNCKYYLKNRYNNENNDNLTLSYIK